MKRKISGYMRNNRYAFLIAFTAIIAGAVSGAFGATRGQISEIVPPGEFSENSIIMSSFLENLKFLAWVALWGINAIGFPVIIYLLYSKGAMLSASLYGLFAVGNANQFLTIISVVPYLMCTVASIVILSQGSLRCSLDLGKSIVLGKNRYNASKSVYKMTAAFVVSLLLAFLGGICEGVFKVNIT